LNKQSLKTGFKLTHLLIIHQFLGFSQNLSCCFKSTIIPSLIKGPNLQLPKCQQSILSNIAHRIVTRTLLCVPTDLISIMRAKHFWDTNHASFKLTRLFFLNCVALSYWPLVTTLFIAKRTFIDDVTHLGEGEIYESLLWEVSFVTRMGVSKNFQIYVTSFQNAQQSFYFILNPCV
jgi:hypothetical protein